MLVKYIHQVVNIDEIVHFIHEFDVPPIEELEKIQDLSIPLMLKATLYCKKPCEKPPFSGKTNNSVEDK
jgi:hypothetical protein